MEVQREYGFMYVKSRDYAALKFLELEFILKRRETFFVEKQISNGKHVLIVKDAI